MATKRRSAEEVKKLVAEIDALVAGGSSQEEAAKKVGLAPSVYQRHKRNEKKPAGQRSPVQRGTMRVDQLPPRPKKGGKRVPRPVNLNDIGSVASRIAKLDHKLRVIDGLVRERIRLVAHLLVMLKDREKQDRKKK